MIFTLVGFTMYDNSILSTESLIIIFALPLKSVVTKVESFAIIETPGED